MRARTHCSCSETLSAPRGLASNVVWLLTSFAPRQYYRQSRHRRKEEERDAEHPRHVMLRSPGAGADPVLWGLSSRAFGPRNLMKIVFSTPAISRRDTLPAPWRGRARPQCALLQADSNEPSGPTPRFAKSQTPTYRGLRQPAKDIDAVASKIIDAAFAVHKASPLAKPLTPKNRVCARPRPV
jgi:hypothetical protein